MEHVLLGAPQGDDLLVELQVHQADAAGPVRVLDDLGCGGDGLGDGQAVPVDEQVPAEAAQEDAAAAADQGREHQDQDDQDDHPDDLGLQEQVD